MKILNCTMRFLSKIVEEKHNKHIKHKSRFKSLASLVPIFMENSKDLISKISSIYLRSQKLWRKKKLGVYITLVMIK